METLVETGPINKVFLKMVGIQHLNEEGLVDMKAMELEYCMDWVERDIRRLGQAMEELIKIFKSFTYGSQFKSPSLEAKNTFSIFFHFIHSNHQFNSICSIFSSNDHLFQFFPMSGQLTPSEDPRMSKKIGTQKAIWED